MDKAIKPQKKVYFVFSLVSNLYHARGDGVVATVRGKGRIRVRVELGGLGGSFGAYTAGPKRTLGHFVTHTQSGHFAET